MLAQVIIFSMRPTVALAVYDFLQAKYDVLLRVWVSNQAAKDAAFEAIYAAHSRPRGDSFCRAIPTSQTEAEGAFH